MADVIRQFQAGHPGDPVFLVAKSGGAGIAVKALEQLDEGRVERAILLAPALSPRYDLTAALRAVRREIVVFWSPLDVMILGAGTRLFGTIDRVKTVGAGLVGFRRARTRRTRRGAPRPVRQAPPGALAASNGRPGYLGGHFGPDHPRFLRKYVVPLLRADQVEPVRL